MTVIKCKTVPTNLFKGAIPVSRYTVLHNGTVREDSLYDDIARKTGMAKPVVKATSSMIFDEIAENLKHGYRVELPEMSAFLTLPGSVESGSAESLKELPPVLVAHLAAKGNFRKCCQGPEFVLENVTQGATVVVNVVIDNVSERPGVLTNGTDVEVHVTGNGLYIPDPADPTVGAYLAASDGTVLVKADVLESTATTLACVFPQIALEPGTYKFCVASRNGLDPVQYGVTVGRRNVEVVDAADEDEGV